LSLSQFSSKLSQNGSERQSLTSSNYYQGIKILPPNSAAAAGKVSMLSNASVRCDATKENNGKK
jgi:hypothetical protein